MRIYNHQVVLREFPDEITLALNISGCKNACPECHSKFLWDEVGDEATIEYVEKLINENPGISCIGIMGGDSYIDDIIDLITNLRNNHSNLKIGWYSGLDKYDTNMLHYLDYIKIGRYDSKYGPLDRDTTNQRMYLIQHLDNMISLTDITQRFWTSSAK